MSYRLGIHEDPTEGIKRVVDEQIDKALIQLKEFPEGKDEAVHDARKRFKKIRAALRLVRDELGEDVYHAENRHYRDAGRRLSGIRDSAVAVKTLTDLIDRFEDRRVELPFEPLYARLVARHEAALQETLGEQEALADVAGAIETGRPRVATWLGSRHGAEAFGSGLRRVYKRGWKAIDRAYAEPTPENFHEWRKRVKYLWYQVRLLKLAWPVPMKALGREVHGLANLLGADHDLAALEALLRSQPDLLQDPGQLQMLVALIHERQDELRSAAWPLGKRIYAERPDRFTGRIAGYWNTRRPESGKQRHQGRLGDWRSQ
ncbi:MAG: CHAD domain-containing protein [Anaerolineae bacterium]|jgi:CHAD domain-containing protein